MLRGLIDRLFVQRKLAQVRRLYERGDAAEALSTVQALLSRRPGLPQAHNLAAVALLALGRIAEAIDQLRRALALRPGYSAAHVNLGNAFTGQGRLDEAIAEYRAALLADESNPEAHLNLAMALEEDGRPAEARAAYERAFARRPNDGVRLKMATMLPRFPGSSAEIDTIRERLDRELDRLLETPLRLDDPAREVGQTTFLLPYQGRNDRDLHSKLARMYERACPRLLYRAPHCARRGRKGRRLRVGFASKHLGAHSVGIWYSRLIALLARLPDFDVVLVDLGGDAHPELRGACARVITPPDHLWRAQEAIAAEALDILVYTDIGMEPLSYFLAFGRLAPVQCTTFGHPVTSGIGNVDYFVSSAWFEPEGAQAHYSEKLALLDALPLYIERPKLPAPPKGRSALGLPQDRTLYVCPMMLHKFHPDFDAAMAGILQRDARAEILLFADARHPARHEALRNRFEAAHGGLVHRLRFLPWASFENLIGIIAAADAVIDTFHFGAGTTAFLVFAAGRPIVTLPGEFARGRPTVGCYRKMGIMDCVARDAQHYVDLAVHLANDAPRRRALGERIAEASGALFSDHAAVTELAAFLRRVAWSGA